MKHAAHNPLKLTWQHFSQRGTAGLGYATARRVMLVNQFCIIAIILNLVYAMQVMLIDAAGLSVFLWLIIIACMAFIGAMYLNGTRYQRQARWILSGIPVTTLFFSAYFIGNGAGLQLYLIVTWTLLFLIYTREELGTLLFFSAVYWLGFLVIEFSFTHPGLVYDYPPGIIDQIYVLSITGTFVAVALVVGLFFNEIHRAEARLQEEFEHSEKLIRNILPSSIADRLKRRDSVNLKRRSDEPAEKHDPIADGCADATVLFADIVGFTPLASSLAPETVVKLLNDVFSGFDEIVLELKLEKIKTIGDAYMLVGGIPEPCEQHVERVADAALRMQMLIADLTCHTGHPLQLRMGMHCGPLVAGVIGKHKFAYDIWGDTVNTASRLESHGLPNRIQVSEPIFERLRNQYTFEKRGQIDLKGRGRINTWFLLDKLSESNI